MALRPLKRRSEYLAVQRAGLRAARPSLVLQAARHGPTAQTQPAGREAGIGVGFTVTRRTGKAVVRNRIRRRLKAAAALVLPGEGRSGVDYVLIGRRGALHRPFAGILRDLRSATRAVHRSLDRGEGTPESRRARQSPHPRQKASVRKERANDS